MQQSSPDNRLAAEQRALSRIASALRGRYDIQKAFACEGERRDAELVGCAVEKRYKDAIEYLKEIQAGRVIPDIPTVMGPDGEEDFHNPIRYGSAARNEYIW